MAKASIAVLGASGLVGSRLCELWADRYDLIAPAHTQLDVLDADALARFMAATRAKTIVNCAAWADVDGAEREKGDKAGMVYRLNADYPRRLAELTTRHLMHLIHVSTDYVFDGTKDAAPYTEPDATNAVCWYAETKLLGEQAALDASETVCVARIEMPFTAREFRKSDLARTFATRLARGQPVQGVVDQRITPIFLDDAASALAQLVDAGHAGVIHVAAATWTTPYAFATGIADRLGLPTTCIQEETFANFSATRPAPRPKDSWLDVSHFMRVYGEEVLKPVEDELDRWVAQWQSR